MSSPYDGRRCSSHFGHLSLRVPSTWLVLRLGKRRWVGRSTCVEFGDTRVFDYDRQKVHALSAGLPASPALVYEAHSTDYQTPAALAELVEYNFAILKVGPWLTFAYREAIFALSGIEREILGHRREVRSSQVRETLEFEMLRNPASI